MTEINNKKFKDKAKKKLEKQLEKADDKYFAERIIAYLIEKCEEDEGLAEDVCQEHKTWKKCFDYIYDKAKNVAKNSRQCSVADEIVFEWSEDYFHKDDKAEEEKKAKESAERKKQHKEVEKKQKEEQKKRIERMKKRHEKNGSSKQEKAAEAKNQEEQTTKKNSNELDGQLDLFSLMDL